MFVVSTLLMAVTFVSSLSSPDLSAGGEAGQSREAGGCREPHRVHHRGRHQGLWRGSDQGAEEHNTQCSGEPLTVSLYNHHVQVCDMGQLKVKNLKQVGAGAPKPGGGKYLQTNIQCQVLGFLHRAMEFISLPVQFTKSLLSELKLINFFYKVTFCFLSIQR